MIQKFKKTQFLWEKGNILWIVKISKLPFGEVDTDFIMKLHAKDSQIKESETHVLPSINTAYEWQGKLLFTILLFLDLVVELWEQNVDICLFFKKIRFDGNNVSCWKGHKIDFLIRVQLLQLKNH